MRDPYQPGMRLVLPSGRRVHIEAVRATSLLCRYIAGDGGAFGEELNLTKEFALKHCYLVEGAAA